jgi:hypothetical protein
MPEITTGHNSNARAKCWHVYSSGVRVDIIALRTAPTCHHQMRGSPKHRTTTGWFGIPFPDGWYAAC